VRVRNLEGTVLQSYEGSNPLFMGDTGYRLLAGGTWIDLVTGETIHLFMPTPWALTNLAWTDEDTRFYDCCVSYGDVLNSTYSFRYGLADIFVSGVEVYPDYAGDVAQWFAEGHYVMHEPRATYWAYQEGINGTPLIPLIDPANESYINIGAELGLTETFDCGWVHHLWPFHDQIWLADCHTNLLVAIPELTTQEVSGYNFVEWSPNGRYALLTANDHYTLLDPDTMTFTPLPDVPATAVSPVWSETADYLALTAAENDGVYVVETIVAQSRFAAVQPSPHMAWRPNSNQLALAVADGTITLITADDGSSQILTPALPEVRDLRWSPAGTHLTFVSKTNVNILSFDP
jgi:hypothetical protein